jgi:hypothetical protein
MLPQREKFIKNLADSAEFASYPENLRIAIADAIFKRHCSSRLISRMEACLGIALCLGVVVSFVAGYYWRGLIGSMLLLVIIVFLINLSFAFIMRYVWLFWIKHFLASEEYKVLVGEMNKKTIRRVRE